MIWLWVLLFILSFSFLIVFPLFSLQSVLCFRSYDIYIPSELTAYLHCHFHPAFMHHAYNFISYSLLPSGYSVFCVTFCWMLRQQPFSRYGLSVALTPDHDGNYSECGLQWNTINDEVSTHFVSSFVTAIDLVCCLKSRWFDVQMYLCWMNVVCSSRNDYLFCIMVQCSYKLLFWWFHHLISY